MDRSDRSEAAAERTLLPMHQALTEAEVGRIVEAVRECVTARLAGPVNRSTA